MRRVACKAASALVVLLAVGSPAQASPGMESTFQDDPLLVYNTEQGQAQTLDTLRALGVDRIRVSVFWRVVAPANSQDERPNFDATDPFAYDPDAWTRYDRIVRLAAERGIAVNFNLTSPAPDWATPTPEREDLDDVFDPSTKEWGDFVRAVGTRYSGSYVPPRSDGRPLPRVDYWSIWNEPNQGAWLAPQWMPDPRDGRKHIEASPHLYRKLLDAAYDSLVATGHGNDTILIGETAPKGVNKVGVSRQMKPARFIRQLYCLDDHLQFLKGTSAEVRGCPVTDQARTMAEQHPALFKATGYAHHPYELTFAPDRRQSDREFLTIANLGDLSMLLRRIYQRYGQPMPGGGKDVPLYLTEFGYQTKPPDPLGVSLTQQSAYLNQAEYIAYRNPQVKTLAQFLLVDDKPLPGVDQRTVAAWGGSFQSGLVDLDGQRKPAFTAYAFPFHVTQRKVRKGKTLRVWGRARGAPGTRVQIELKPKGARKYRRLRTVTASRGGRGAFSARVRLHRSGRLRLTARDAAGNLRSSRTVAVSAVVPRKASKRRR